MTNLDFTHAIETPDEVILITRFVEFLNRIGIISEEAAEDFENHLHDELQVCYDCENLIDECKCHDYGREYDDEASFE